VTLPAGGGRRRPQHQADTPAAAGRGRGREGCGERGGAGALRPVHGTTYHCAGEEVRNPPRHLQWTVLQRVACVGRRALLLPRSLPFSAQAGADGTGASACRLPHALRCQCARRGALRAGDIGRPSSGGGGGGGGGGGRNPGRTSPVYCPKFTPTSPNFSNSFPSHSVPQLPAIPRPHRRAYPGPGRCVSPGRPRANARACPRPCRCPSRCPGPGTCPVPCPGPGPGASPCAGDGSGGTGAVAVTGRVVRRVRPHRTRGAGAGGDCRILLATSSNSI